jgi:hypothetical protein
MARKIITRKEAIALGLKRFFTGEPCKHGHVCERRVCDVKCVECHSERLRRWRKANPEKCREQEARRDADVRQEQARARYAAKGEKHWEKRREQEHNRRTANPDKYRVPRYLEARRQANRKWKAANPERVRANDRKWRAANPEKVRAKRRRKRAQNPEKYLEYVRKHKAFYGLMRDILLKMGLITKEDSPAEQRGLVRAYQELGLINREEIEEWLNTQTLKKA